MIRLLTFCGSLLVALSARALDNRVDAPAAPRFQTAAEAAAKSDGCVSCHTASDQKTMHESRAVVLGCTDCHGGDAAIRLPQAAQAGDTAYRAAQDQAHVAPRLPGAWNYPHSANPPQSFTLLNKEAPAFVRFINPGDYRVAREACGACHLPVIEAAERSLMATGAMFWGGAAYNNGVVPYKRSLFGEAYTRDGHPAVLKGPVQPDANMVAKGILPRLLPLPAWETTPPGDVFRVFESGGRNIGSQFPETGLPSVIGNIQRLEEPGRPDLRQSNRGPGTGNRISVPTLNLHKTRLNDPFTWFLGTNDQPGDYRSSGCSSCHVVYANDRNPKHSGPYAAFGHTGKTQTADPTIPKAEEGHPLKHAFTRAIPSAQCIVCHLHQPNVFVNSFLGYTMWDYESDAPLMWPKAQKYPSDAEIRAINQRNPEEAATRGLWGERKFLDQVSELNSQAKDTQFADYHGHGWNFRAIYKRDRKGNLLDDKGAKVADDDPKKFEKSTHLASIHLEKGMHCVDCHFSQDTHGNGHLYGEVAQAIEIDCQDCHGSVDRRPNLRTSGPAAPPGGTDLSGLRTPDGRRRFEWIGSKLYQRSALTPGLEWEVHTVKDSVTPGSAHYNAKAARAKLMSRDKLAFKWGGDVAPDQRAHKDEEMVCATCHTSWTNSCSGCHLPIQANWKSERGHFEGGETRNYATYNPQVARDDMYILGKHGEAKGRRVAPVRSSSALVLSSTNANRERIYTQQPPISASGFSSQAFNPHYAHTERTTETKTCSDCHLSEANDNNAVIGQLLGLGTGFVNFIGYHAFVGTGDGIAAVQVTEWEEPQAVIGSYLHRYAYPDWYRAHESRGRILPTAHSHAAGDAVNALQLRGEYLFAAAGTRGLQVFDVATVGNKGFSQPITTGAWSPLGQQLRVDTENAAFVVLPTNQPISPQRNAIPMMQTVNQEQRLAPIYSYALIADRAEGLILVDVDTLADGDARNNFLRRALTFNPAGILNGAQHISLAGSRAYVSAEGGLVVVDLADPLKPRVETVLLMEGLRSTALQFRYLLAVTSAGLQTLDVTDPARPVTVADAFVPLTDAHRVYLARTYAYVAAGPQGLVIVDIENPEKPRLYQQFDGQGRITDARDVVVGSTNASLFAYIADGANGLHVVQLTAPDTQPKFYGYTPEPKPQWIARHATKKPALALSKGLERDRAVDESGGQIAVFGRIGSRPFNLQEMRDLYLRSDGKPWFVSDDPAPSAAP
ncbi:hypothetical protein [Nevskia sp.]|uniref:LVIVD repeat-containing protein n=1 Tax=Nevskia sp. TaxID=1929292 RepID=UPI0025D100EA|nr:hypothetical protein [Nevskia sp.]